MVSIFTGTAYFIATLKWFPIREMLRSFSVDLLIFALLLLLPAKITRAAILALFVPLLLLSFTSVEHVAIYKSGISSFSVISTLETSANEAAEFLFEFVTLPNVISGALVVVIAVFLLLKTISANSRIARNRMTSVVALLIIGVCVYVIAIKGHSLLNSNSSYVVINGMSSYSRDLQLVNKIKSTRSGQIYSGIQVLDDDPAAEKIYIFIIGESANRNHMSLYGYGRETTPELKKLATRLYVFNDVASASTHTIPSLRKALFFHHDIAVDSHQILDSRSIVGLLGRAGFDTWWLSNQTANSDGLTGTALFAEDADHKIFLNKSRSEGHSISYDQVLLDELEKILRAKTPRKAIFVHLLGSHLSYHLRYPKEFDVFTSTTDIPDAQHRNSGDKIYINQYDNSILYTDYVVSRIIGMTEKRNKIALVVYFSDHGQEVYDSLPIRGQDAMHPTRNMFDVPFILWMSGEYLRINPELAGRAAERVDIPFSLSWFADTAADLARVRFDGVTAEHSLFAPHYHPPAKREIPYGGDYDTLPPLE
jgi:heptose-I-phosphate ethanolaminephosphotransferase